MMFSVLSEQFYCFPTSHVISCSYSPPVFLLISGFWVPWLHFSRMILVHKPCPQACSPIWLPFLCLYFSADNLFSSVISPF